MKLVSIFSILIFPLISSAVVSPLRLPNESYQEAFRRNSTRLKKRSFDHLALETPYSKAVPIEKLELNSATKLNSHNELTDLFIHVRDKQFIKMSEQPVPQRRISWLYPDDGCYTRAMMMSFELLKDKKIDAKKIFVFGNLRARTSFSPNGIVRWWYHVAVLFNVENKLYVFDPSVNFERPISLVEWKTLVSDADEKVKFSICSANTYSPDDRCDSPRPYQYEGILDHQMRFLDMEWDRVLELELDPFEVLGNTPPWLSLNPQAA